MVIHLWHVKKYYGAELVLSDVSFEIGETEKVGLIGRNGTGKTTVLRLLDRASVPDEGETVHPQRRDGRPARPGAVGRGRSDRL